MKIALDLDDVILDFSGVLLRCVQKEYGVDLTAQFEERYWDLHAILDPVVGESWWKWWRARDWLWATSDAVDGAIGAIRTLRKDGHYLEILTAKPEWAEPQTWRWLGKWRPPVHAVRFVGMDEKKSDCSDCDVLVDDKPENITDWQASRPRLERTGVLFDRPHNRKTEGLIRAANWTEVLNIIQFLAVTAEPA